MRDATNTPAAQLLTTPVPQPTVLPLRCLPGARPDEAPTQALPRHPVLLILDGHLPTPWESTPGCGPTGNRICRSCVVLTTMCNRAEDKVCPAICAVTTARIKGVRLLCAGHMGRVYRVPSLACAWAVLAAPATSAQGRGLGATSGIDPRSAYYLLNPSGDLATTQAAFQDWFAHQQGWQVRPCRCRPHLLLAARMQLFKQRPSHGAGWRHWVQGEAGQAVAVEQVVAALQRHDLFVYLGHGSGEQYLPPHTLRRLEHCSAALLMGCSSGRLRVQGHYEPTGAVLAYLLAGEALFPTPAHGLERSF